jgi:hypothetical protein
MTMQIKAGQRLKVAASVDPDSVPAIKAAMKKICDLFEDVDLGEGARLGTTTPLPDEWEIPGMRAPIAAREIFFEPASLRAIAKILEGLDQQEDGVFSVGFEIEGGKLCMIIADSSEM